MWAMAEFAKKNLREVEDAAVEHGFSETQEARFAGGALGCETIGLALESVKPNSRQAFGHRHEVDEEVYVVLRGSGRMRLDDEVVEVGPLDAIRVAPGVMRSFEADGEGVELLAFGTHTEGDGEIDPGFWVD
jgi:mannose-6-phosphate isomerase-like protein (cupin superfamily)